jgi:hypothetical protein
MPLPLSPKSGLGMKVTVLPLRNRHVLDNVLEPLQGVAHGKQRIEAHVDFALAAGGDFVVGGLDTHADALQHLHHFVTQVDQRVGRRAGEVAFLVARLVAEVGEFFAAGVPDAFDGIDGVEGLVAARGVADVVEDEEFRLGTEVGGVGNAGRLQVGFGLPGQQSADRGCSLPW